MQKDWLDKLNRHHTRLRSRSIASLFGSDRMSIFSYGIDGCYLDFSKQLIDGPALNDLFDVARLAKVPEAIASFFGGEVVNQSERRPAMHMALRTSSFKESTALSSTERDFLVTNDRRTRLLAEQVRAGEIRSSSGKRPTDLIHVGIGGSDLGPRLVATALYDCFEDYGAGDSEVEDNVSVHFLSNVDYSAIDALTRSLDPERCLVVVASKSFITQETLGIALYIKEWLSSAIEDANSAFIGISANAVAMQQFGINEARQLLVWDSVGGRYSLWSAMAFPILVAVGGGAFDEVLAGAEEIDRHFAGASLDKNIPVLLALIGVWCRNVCGLRAHAVLTYSSSLSLLPTYLQQLEMESNGKDVRQDGQRIKAYDTSPIIWGGTGTDAQHAFFQYLHQGTDVCSTDLIAFCTGGAGRIGSTENTYSSSQSQLQRILVSNCFAQSAALMFGRTKEESIRQMLDEGFSKSEAIRLSPFRSFSGNRPSTTLLFDELSPKTLGRLIAIYEHKVFVQGVLWGINSFDQWGVELGKGIGRQILAVLQRHEHDETLGSKRSTPLSTTPEFDPSTDRLIAEFKSRA